MALLDRGGRVISTSCFRLLSLQAEIQNESEVLKPILEELEVMRLSCALGMLSNVSAKELEFDHLDASDFDDDFARFLRSDIFGRGRSESTTAAGVTPTEPASVRVVGLFGKRREIKAHLSHLKVWDSDMERKLSKSRDQGIYGVLVDQDADSNAEAGVPARTLVMFCWLQSGVFDADRLRDTATYILRFLTCLTNDVTCCLSDEDVELMEKIVGDKSGAGNGVGNAEEDWKSYSVAFHVEQQRDQDDDVRSQVTQVIWLPPALASFKQLSLAKGTQPILYTIVDAPVRKRTRRDKQNFDNLSSFCNWIKVMTKQYELKCDAAGWSPEFKKAVLTCAGGWPEWKIREVTSNADKQLAAAGDRYRAELATLVLELRPRFERAAGVIFRAEAVMKEEVTMQTIATVDSEIQSMLTGVRVTQESKTLLSLPQRMVELLKRCLEFFEQGREVDLDQLLNEAAVTMLKDREQGSPTRAIMSAVSSWFGGRSYDAPPTTITNEFRQRVSNALEVMRQMWMSEVVTVLETKNELMRQNLLENEKMILQGRLEHECSNLVDDALASMFVCRPNANSNKNVSPQKPAWGAPTTRQQPRQDTPQQNRLAISFRVATTRQSSRVAVEFEKEELTSSSKRVVVWSMKTTNPSSAGGASKSKELQQFQVDSLGDTELAPEESVLGLYSISLRSILLVTTSAQAGTSIRRVNFPASSYQRNNEAVVVPIRSFPRAATLCDFNAKDRVLALVGPPDRVNLYRFNDTFSGLEVMRSIDVRLKTSLAEPLQEILLADGALFMVDHNGAMQSLNTRNQQTSRKHNLPPSSSPSTSPSRCPLFVLEDGAVLGWTSPNADRLSATGRMCFASADNVRELPQSVSANVFSASHSQLLSTCFVDNSLFVFDEDTRRIQVIQIEATLKSDSYRIRTVDNESRKASTGNGAEQQPSLRMLADHWLWTFYHLYEKFPVRGELYRGTSRTQQFATLEVAFAYDDEQKEISSVVQAGCQEFFREVMNKLENLNKPLYGMDLSSRVEVFSGDRALNINQLHYARLTIQSVASFLRELVTFVPIQICRAEHNTLTLMRDGQDKPHVQQHDAGSTGGLQSADIAQTIRFGLLSPLLQSWRDQCIVVTSMGKQSTGKSYFLNHLTGSSFAISGARCTDGAWMSLRVLPAQGVLLVVIDFEGLGSFERTEQEDVFLSVLNASLSMLTIFRMEMRLDKEIDDLFAKFQKGSQLLKSDPRLFRGKLYMAVKDVNPNDQKNVVGEFVVKFQRLLEANKERNFLTDMYAGQLDINCSPPLGTLGYYRSLTHAQQYITTQLCGNPKAGFQSGKAFLDCLRLLLAKITILDWTSLDDSAVQFKVAEASRQLPSVLRYGGHVVGGDDDASKGKSAGGSGGSELVTRDELVCVKSGAKIVATLDEVCAMYPPMAAPWRRLAVSTAAIDRIEDDVIDFGSALSRNDAAKVQAASASLASLFATYSQLSKAQGGENKSVKVLQQEFDSFLAFAVRRRCLRVDKWSRSLFGGRVPEQWLASQSQSFSALQTLFVRCLDRCAKCQLGCMKVSSHSVSDHAHDCGTSHSCDNVCGYCSQSAEDKDAVAACAKPAGHDGMCECASGEHTCTEPCDLHHAVNCGKVCSKKTGHDDSDVHRCSVSLHKCGQPCEANDCKRQCVHDIEAPHTVHKCEVDRCLSRCVMDGCDRQCSSTDHFHGRAHEPAKKSPRKKGAKNKQAQFDTPPEASVVHMCSEAHACPDMCAQDGVCHIDVFLKQSSRTFVGARGTFQYTFQEMNGSRKKCARRLEPGQMAHNGAHSCDAEDQENRERALGLGDDEEEKAEVGESNASGSDRARVCHYCDVRCPCCSYYCQLAHGHSGLHQTSHGNMRNTMFLSEDQEIDVMDRKYAAGERGTAEMCNLYCSKMGRAHVHFLDCDQSSRDTCVYTGSSSDMRRHCTRTLEPKPDREQDEVLHERFWDTLGWEDPCASTQEKEEFGKCGFKCDAPEHEGKETSFCVLPAWHAPATADPGAGDGFSIIDGHKFECTHIAEGAKMHHVFVLDSSGSMSGGPWSKLIGAFREFIHNRILVGSTQDLVSVVTFDSDASIVWEAADIATMTQADVPFRGGGTSFGAGLRCANEVLSRMDFETYKPVVIFFSDGQPGDAAAGDQLAAHMAQTYAKYGLEAFAVGFGDMNLSVLERVAQRLGGTYHQVLSGDELKQTFQTISASVGAKAGLALTRPIHEMVCVICQKELASEATTVLTPCQHELHRRCFRSLSDQATKDGTPLLCPSCRRGITV